MALSFLLVIRKLYDWSSYYHLPCPFCIPILFHRRTESRIIIKWWHVHWSADICFIVFNIIFIVTSKMLCTIAEFVRNFTLLWFMTINHDMHYLYAQPNMIKHMWVVQWISSLERRPHGSPLKLFPAFIIYLLHRISCIDYIILQTTTGTDLDLSCIYGIYKMQKRKNKKLSSVWYNIYIHWYVFGTFHNLDKLRFYLKNSTEYDLNLKI